MPAMGRKTFRKLLSVFAAGSLALDIAVAGLWGVSYWRQVGITHVSRNLFPEQAYDGEPYETSLYQGVAASGGVMVLFRHTSTLEATLPAGWMFYADPRDPGDFTWAQVLWFAHQLSVFGKDPYSELSVPLWFPLLLSLILPAVWLRRFRSERRKKREGLCRRCGYDLRAHLPGQVCPECGTAVPGDLVRKPMG